MTDITVIAPRSQQPAPAKDKPIGKITRRVRTAIEAMVWQGLQRKDAAAHAGLAEHSLYQALRRPPVRALYLSELDVLRTSGRARRIHRLEAIVEQDTNLTAAVAAAKALENIDDVEHQRLGSLAPVTPGLIVVVQAPAASTVTAQHRVIDAKPLIDQEASQSSSDDDPGNGRG